ncbi:DUF4335 domain-containing protein [Geminocystis sp.]|uniref:DUF4335 domain-containing protein n=1 Tax=Geminocystis sp. TaxID=2664100 RepID=UPI0035949220
MVINASSSFRRYTPPTCTLEIYHPQSFWGYFGPKPFPQLFSFQLHFDDPRVPKEDRSTIIGDRDLLEKLRKKVQEYINNYLKITPLTEEDLVCELPSQNEEEFISLTRDCVRGHRLFYQCFVPKEETLEVTLSNTQLLDFINALSAYHLDATRMTISKDELGSNNIGLGILITTLACMVGGGIWWRYEKQVATNEINNPSQANIENITPNVEELIPPSPLDPKTLPSIIAPEVPESLKNRETLLPPAAITKPSMEGENDALNSNNSGVASQTQIIIPPPPTPSAVNVPTATKETNDINPANIMMIQPSLPPAPPLSVTPSFQPPQPTVKSIPQYPSRLSSLPVLKSSNSDSGENSSPNTSTKPIESTGVVGINSFNRVSPSVIENTPDFTVKTISPSLNQQKFAGIITNEVKQYFQSKWQPPENLKQSIEYRLNFSQNGSLTKITPVGQVATVFLDRTGMPLLGEKLTSSFTETDQLTVRLILSPNGNVQTFNESK